MLFSMTAAGAVNNSQLSFLTANKQVCCWQTRNICFITSSICTLKIWSLMIYYSFIIWIVNSNCKIATTTAVSTQPQTSNSIHDPRTSF